MTGKRADTLLELMLAPVSQPDGSLSVEYSFVLDPVG